MPWEDLTHSLCLRLSTRAVLSIATSGKDDFFHGNDVLFEKRAKARAQNLARSSQNHIDSGQDSAGVDLHSRGAYEAS